MKYPSFLIVFYFLLLGAGCDESTNSSTDTSGEWLIPKDQIFDGGPGKDGIPALLNPQVSDIASINFLEDADLVIAIKFGDEVRVYPHPILDWHEIINDEINGNKFAITYCPLTGSGIAWNRVLNGQETTFGVSGLLYNTNLIPYDRATQSNWSQMKMQCVNGSLIGTSASVLPLIETSWKTIKQAYPNAKVVTTETGYSRSYDLYPYGDYKTNNDLLIFPVSPDDTRLPRKERVLGAFINGINRAYKFQDNGSELTLFTDNVDGNTIVVISCKEKNLNTVFQSTLDDGTNVSLSPVQNELPIILTDSEANKYDLFGEVIAGPKKDSRLKSVSSMTAYWFGLAAFYPNISIAN